MIEYPIFNSVVNRIEAELIKYNVHLKSFKTWTEASINATGLEIIAELPTDELIKSVVINFDWDKFREASLARSMDGMSKHPLLRNKNSGLTPVTPSLDIEISWQFNEGIPFKISQTRLGTNRIKVASEWMDSINTKANQALPRDCNLSRWHVDIDGDFEGRFISQMTFITYLSIPLDTVTSLTGLQQRIDRNLQILLKTTDRILDLAKSTLPMAS
jgi:hypothetical protein